MAAWRWVAVGVGAVALVGAGVLARSGLLQGPQERAVAPPERAVAARAGVSQERAFAVEVVRITRRTVERRVTYHGVLEPRTTADLGVKTGGRVAELPVEVGSRVSKGDVLLRLETSELEAQVQQARASLAAARAQLQRLLAGARQEERDQAEAALHQADAELGNAREEFKRSEALFERGGISRQAYDAARSRLQVAEAQLRGARARLEELLAGPRKEDVEAARAQVAQAEAALTLANTRLADATLVAPFDGVVSRREVERGEVVAPGTVLVSLVDLGELKLPVQVGGREVLALEPGLPADVRVDGLPDRTFRGRVHRIDPVADPRSNLFGVEVRVPNPEGLLRAGLPATVEIPVARAPDTLAVPEAALLQQQGQAGVFVVEDGRARFQPVELGLNGGDWWEVRSGLEEGDPVVITGKEQLGPGSPVVVTPLEGGERR